MKAASTGSRLGMSEQQAAAFMGVLLTKNVSELHHGDCQGSDEQANNLAQSLDLRTVAHPPTGDGLRAFCHVDETRDPQPYLTRNRSLVLATEFLIATPDGPQRLRSGTWATVRFAKRSGVPGVVIYPDGTMEEW